MSLNSVPAASADPATWVGEMVGRYRLTNVWWEDTWSRSFVAASEEGEEYIVVFFFNDLAPQPHPQKRASGLLLTLRQFSQVRGVRTCLAHGRVTSGPLNGLEYVITERSPGIGLGEYVAARNGRLPLSDAALIVHQVAMVLQAGHLFRNGNTPTPIFHGSLCLSDIVLVQEPPHPRVSVGGYERLPYLPAAVEDEFRRRRQQEVSLQDAAWLSTVAPELVGRKNSDRRVNEATDVYGLGVLFWTLLFGRPPRPTRGDHEKLAEYWRRTHVDHKSAYLPEEAKQLGREVRDLLLKCVHSDLSERPPTPLRMAQGLELLVPEVAHAEAAHTASLHDDEEVDSLNTIHLPSVPAALRRLSPLPPTVAPPPARPESRPSPVPPLPPIPEKEEPFSASAPPLAPGRGHTFFGDMRLDDTPVEPYVARPPPVGRDWGKAIFVAGMLLVLFVVAISVWPNILRPETSRVQRPVRRVPVRTPTQEVHVVVADADVEPVFTEVVRPPQPVVPPVTRSPALVVDPRDSRACTLAVINAGLGRRVTVAQKDACRRYCLASPTSDEVRRRSERYGLCPRAGPSPVPP